MLSGESEPATSASNMARSETPVGPLTAQGQRIADQLTKIVLSATWDSSASGQSTPRQIADPLSVTAVGLSTWHGFDVSCVGG